MKINISLILLIMCNLLFSQSPVVENVRFEQRKDGSLLVDIYYDLLDTDHNSLYVFIEASDNCGGNWDLTCISLTGDIGCGITPGKGKHVVWDFYKDNPDTSGYCYTIRVTANENLCGIIINKDFTLTEDIFCTSHSPVISITAPNITLDLGGHTISGKPGQGSLEAIIINNVEGVNIKNGTIDGFIGGIRVQRSDNTTIENITIKNLQLADPDSFVVGIGITGSENVLIKDSYFEFLFAAHKEAIIIDNSQATITNIETRNGSVGVNFGGNGLTRRSTGEITNCKFINSSIASILIQQTNNAKIINNEFIGGSIGLDPWLEGTVTGVTIDGNNMRDGGGEAILYRGGTETVISNNVITNFSTGIALTFSRGCGPDSVAGADCSYASGNLITNNTVTGNWLDLFHCDSCLGNTWRDNIFETALGLEIYTANPVTANKFFDEVDSVANTLANDAELIFVFSAHKDTIGYSIKWIYIYRSASLQRDFELWYHNGKVIKRTELSIPYMVNEGNQPITTPWIDSDSAMVIAEGMGGRNFRKENEILAIEISLFNTSSFVWQIDYISKDSSFRASIDALKN
jgi:hypothetical protein